MKKIHSSLLLQQAKEDVREIILKATYLKQADPQLLEQQPADKKWSVAQVLDHLNVYARFYINAIEKKINHHQTVPEVYFTPGWLGNYFTQLMKPGNDGKIKSKMKAPANAVPAAGPNAMQVLEEFLQHQHHLLNLLQIAENANIGRLRIPTSLSAFIRLKLGDTFRFLTAHQQRHFIQIQRAISDLDTQALTETNNHVQKNNLAINKTA